MPEDKTIAMPHLGANVNVKVLYVEPTIGELKELDFYRGKNIAFIQKLCQITLEVDGKKQPNEWWDALPEGPYTEIRDYMLANRPKDSEESGSPLGASPGAAG